MDVIKDVRHIVDLSHCQQNFLTWKFNRQSNECTLDLSFYYRRPIPRHQQRFLRKNRCANAVYVTVLN